MFCWEPEGRYRCTKSMVIEPFWFSTEHHWIALTTFWCSTEDISIFELFFLFKIYWSIGAFILAEISGIQISVFASQSKSLKNLLINRGIHTCGNKRDTNLVFFTSVDIKISLIIAISISLQIARNLAIICITADVWTLEQIILVFYIPSFQASISKQGQGLYSGLISGMRSSVNRIIPLGD